MAQLDALKRIVAEDFKKEDKEMIEKLASILNFHMDQVANAFNGKINFENLTQEIVEITVVVNSSGQPVKSITDSSINSNFQFSTSRLTGAIGSAIISAQNLTDPSAYTSSAPFMHFEKISDKLFKINKINGLPAANKFLLRAVIYSN